MPIFIAKTHDGKVESVVLAKNYELAQAYWQGKQIYAHTVDSKNEEDLLDHPTGVLPIVHTKKLTIPRYGLDAKEWLIISKE